MKNEVLEAARRQLQQTRGADFKGHFTAGLLYASGVGHVQVLPREGGGSRYMLLPKMVYSRRRTRWPNRAWSGPNAKLNSLGIMNKQMSQFLEGMPIISEDCYQGPAYSFRDGIRWVEPYYAVYSSTVAARTHPGVDISILEFLVRRFVFIPEALHRLSLERGITVVNLDRVSPDYIVREGDVVTRLAHIHESPVLDAQVGVVHEDKDVLVVDKPASWPVHPCGNYRLNSLLYILARERGYSNLRPIHRLDKATSGLVICARQAGVAAKLQHLINKKETLKEYLALVYGRFDEGSCRVATPLSQHKINPGRSVGGQSKEAETEFTRLAFFPIPEVSLVKCRPITGRTHQIRLHLKELGFTIVNDDLYCDAGEAEHGDDEAPSHPSSEYNRRRTARILHRLEELINNPVLVTRAGGGVVTTSGNPADPVSKAPGSADKDIIAKSLSARFAACPYCPTCLDSGELSAELRRPSFIALHSARYRLAGSQLDFRSALPLWATRPETLLNRIDSRLCGLAPCPSDEILA